MLYSVKIFMFDKTGHVSFSRINGLLVETCTAYIVPRPVKTSLSQVKCKTLQKVRKLVNIFLRVTYCHFSSEQLCNAL